MSRIVTHRKCDNCGYEHDGYWSYGHPDHDIHYEWKCKECGHINHRVAKAWPMGDLGWVNVGELKNKSEVELINNIIVEAVLEGADTGGTYRCNTENLVQSVQTWLNLKNLNDKYEVCETVDVLLSDSSYLPCPQIQKKE